MTQNHKLIAALVANLKDFAIFTLDGEGVITSWNKGVREILGYEEHEFTGHKGDIIFTPEDREAGVPEQEMRVAKEQGRAPDDRWHLRKDGSRVFVSGILAAHYDPDGALVGFAKIIRDETKRQQAEAAVARSEARYRALVEVGDAAVWRTDARGNLIWTNEAFERLSGLDLKSAQVEGWLDAIHPDERSRAAEAWRRALATLAPYDVEHRVRGRDGRYRWVHSRAVPVLAEDGSVREWMGADTDISQRKEAEERFRAIVTQAVAGIAETDLSGRFTLVNDRYSEITGYPQDELLSGMRMQDITHPEDVAANLEAFSRCVADGTPFVIEKRYLRKDGTEVWVSNSVAAERDTDGKPRHVVAVTLDITMRKRAEAALAASEAKYATAFQAGPMVLSLTRQADGRFAEVNERFLSLTGYEREEVLGKTPLELSLWLEPDKHLQGLSRLRQGHAVRNVEADFRMKNGSVRTALVAADLITIDGQAHVHTALMDITDRKRAEEALAASEAKYATAFQAGPMGLTLSRLSDGTLYDVNDYFLELTGYAREEVLGKTPDELGLWLERGKRRQGLARLQRGQPVRDLETQFRMKDGSVRTCLVSGDLVEIGGETYAHTALIDITERKRAEEALRQSEARFRHLTNAVPPLIWTTDSEGRPTYYNDGWLSYTGLTADELLAPGGAARTIHPEDFPKAAAQWRAEKGSGQPFTFEYRLRRRDGAYEWHLVQAVPVFEGGSIVEWIGSALNIQERKLADQERERLLAELNALNETLEERVRERTQQVQALAGELTLAEAREQARLAQMLHDDLQQQLYTVQFALHDLRRRLTEDAEVQAALEGVNTLIKAAVVSARGTTANLSPPVLRGEGLVEAVRWLGTDLKERYGLLLEVEAASAPVIPDESVRVLLFNLVRELLFNVVKHAGVKEARVALRDRDSALEIEVADQGKGFDPAVLERYSQGTGLGLSGVRKRLQLFGGQLGLESAPGRGTRVTILLPHASTTLN